MGGAGPIGSAGSDSACDRSARWTVCGGLAVSRTRTIRSQKLDRSRKLKQLRGVGQQSLFGIRLQGVSVCKWFDGVSARMGAGQGLRDRRIAGIARGSCGQRYRINRVLAGAGIACALDK
jgi:hypothetical protein